MKSCLWRMFYFALNTMYVHAVTKSDGCKHANDCVNWEILIKIEFFRRKFEVMEKKGIVYIG